MKTSLTVISLLLAAALPATIFAEFVGLGLPLAFDASHVLGAFAISLTLLTMLADYTPSIRPLVSTPTSRTADVTPFPNAERTEPLAA